jgi:hypothetical protein
VADGYRFGGWERDVSCGDVAALETEVAAYLEAHRDERDADGLALVVRNGKGRTRKVTVGSGTIAVSAPRVHNRRTDQDDE